MYHILNRIIAANNLELSNDFNLNLVVEISSTTKVLRKSLDKIIKKFLWMNHISDNSLTNVFCFSDGQGMSPRKFRNLGMYKYFEVQSIDNSIIQLCHNMWSGNDLQNALTELNVYKVKKRFLDFIFPKKEKKEVFIVLLFSEPKGVINLENIKDNYFINFVCIDFEVCNLKSNHSDWCKVTYNDIFNDKRTNMLFKKIFTNGLVEFLS
jgi:hypothetical protein